MKENLLKEKTYAFALRIVKLSRYLNEEKREFVLSKQILRSGTAIGALIRESEYGQSRKDFINKLSVVALKEAGETEYWLVLLKDGKYITEKMFLSIKPDIDEIIKLLTASIKTAKKNLESNK
ncbi:MAG: four helix bundle protein [Calditrichaeota bacterium]|nr:four helix bundle protein [Calditrichota bacterium]